MKTISLFFVTCLTVLNAQAADSDWKLCKGDAFLFDKNVKIVTNAYEHRSSNGRMADLTMIYGGHVLKGNIDTSNESSANTILKGPKSSYQGHLEIDYANNTLSLNGKLTLGKSTSNLQATLECETL